MLGRRLLMSSSGGPADPDWANVLSLVTGKGANGARPATDSKGNSITYSGASFPQISTAQSYWPSQYGSAMEYNGGDRLSIAAGSTNLGSLFTIDGEFRIPSTAPSSRTTILGTDDASGANTGLVICAEFTGGVFKLRMFSQGGGISATGATTIATDTWYAFSLGRNGSNDINMYLGTTLQTTTNTSATFTVSNTKFYIGSWDQGGTPSNPFSGWMNDIRITRNVYRSSIGTIPTYPAPTH